MKAKRLKRKLNVTNTSIIKKNIKEEMSESNTCTLEYRKKSIWELKKQQDMYNYTLRGNLRDKITETE